MRNIPSEEIENAVYRLAKEACLNLIPSCKAALEKAEREESGESAKFALSTLLKNAEVAAAESMAVCQDTGYAVILAEIGQDAHVEGKLFSDAVNDGVRRAYEDFRFRKSVCDPITRVNTADNTPAAVHTEIVAGDKISLTFLPKGFGSENMSRIYMLTPAKGVNGILDAIEETVKLAGSKPCPPVFVGVGIGGTFDTCALLAKKSAHARSRFAQSEKRRCRDRRSGARKDKRTGHRPAGIRRQDDRHRRMLRTCAHAHRGAARGDQHTVPLRAVRKDGHLKRPCHCCAMRISKR